MVAAVLIGYWAIPGTVMVVKIRGQPLNMYIIQVYAPITDSSEDDIIYLYDQLNQAKSLCKSQVI